MLYDPCFRVDIEILEGLKTILENKQERLKQLKLKNKMNKEEQTPQLNIPAVSGSYIWLVEDCDGSIILSAHLTEEDAEKEREKLRSGYASRVDFRVYGVMIS